jgi:hypothetical protein
MCCTGSRLRKTRRVSRGKPFWACDILGLQQMVKERVGCGGRAADFVAFDSKKKRLMVTWSTRVQEVSKTASKGA